MLNYHFLLDLAFILISTKVLGLVSRKVQMPQVVGALLAGLILGPSIFNVVNETTFIKQTAEIGVIILLFSAGLDTDLKEIKNCGKASLIIALFGVFTPLILGFGVATLFFPGFDKQQLLQNIFLGVILTATSVSISVETLQELGKLNTKSGTAIIGAALIDDVLGIVILTIITGFASSDGTSVGAAVLTVLFKITLFFIFAGLVGILFNKLFIRYSKGLNEKRRFPIISIAFCLLMAFIAEHFFNVADITGAFIAGIVFSNTSQARYIGRRVNTLSYLYLSPIFFASIGISTNLREINLKMLLFGLAVLVVAILSKVVGCGFGAKINHFTKKESLRVGVGMSARSEVALIVANNGVDYGIMNPALFPVVILIVIITSIATPVMLKMAYSNGKAKECPNECFETTKSNHNSID